MASIDRLVVTKPYLDVNCQLGEAPFFDPSRNILRIVDNITEKLHLIRLDIGPSSHTTLKLPCPVASTVEIEGNDNIFVCGTKYGFCFFMKDNGHHGMMLRWPTGVGYEYGIDIKGEKMVVRSNTGAVDSRGRYWTGLTGYDNLEVPNKGKRGVLYRLDRDCSLHRIVEGLNVPNGISWSLDNTVMYITGLSCNGISAYPFDLHTGNIDAEKGRVLWKVKQGVLYGHCQDREGCLWVANHGNARVWRVSPQGHTLAEIVLPTRCVTGVAFAGTRLYITTMAELEPDEYPESVVHQGALFSVGTGCLGRVSNKSLMRSPV